MTEKQGNRENIKKQLLEDLRKQLTEAELERIQYQREFDKVDKESHAGRLGVAVDPLRVIRKEMRQEVEKKLWNITNLMNQRKRLTDQLQCGKITEKLKDGVTMNENEVLAEIEHAGWLLQSEADALPKILWQLRGVVGQHDVLKKEIMTEKEFTQFVDNVEKRLQEYGLSLY